MSINLNLKVLTEVEVENIIRDDKIIDNIDDVIWYLYDREKVDNMYSWLRNN